MIYSRTPLSTEGWIIMLGSMSIVMGVLIRKWIINTYYGIQCKKWPGVKGKIINTPHADEIYQTGSQSASTYLTGYKVRIKYEYKVNGIDFEGATVSFNDSVANNPLATEMYENGDEVDVYFNPKKPSISVLIR
jgi:Protein of unknown function (DUF3592)